MESSVRKKRSDALSEAGESKRCSRCDFTKLLTDFNRNYKCKDGHQTVCRECTRAQDRKRLEDPIKAQEGRDRASAYYYNDKQVEIKKREDRQLFLKMKALSELGMICSGCGEDHPAALQFHHIDPKEKSFSLSTKTLGATKKFPWEDVLEELKKCQILCANCHAKHHTVWEEEVIDGFRETLGVELLCAKHRP
jgi:hypothetical protein